MKKTMRHADPFTEALTIKAFAFICMLLLLPCGLTAQNVSDGLNYRTDTIQGTAIVTTYSYTYDTIPSFYNHIWDIGFGFTFPLQDFHASDPDNGLAGYALQGHSLSLGLFSGFSEGSEAGWYFGAAYSGFRKTGGFTDSLNAALAQFPFGEPGDESVPEYRIIDDYNPRYHIVSLRTGLAFEGTDERVAAYGSFLLNLNFTRMNYFTVGDSPANRNVINIPTTLSSGFSAAFGLRFQQQLSLGLAWHYLGAPSLEFDTTDARGLPAGVFQSIPMERRIHYLEVKMGYGFARRGGPRVSKVRVVMP